MHRILDYLNFALSFTGLGYVVIWPVSAVNEQGDLFGTALLCGGDIALLSLLCAWPHPVQLSPSLHLLGMLAASYVLARLALRFVQHLRRRQRVTLDAAVLAERLPDIVTQPRPSKPSRPLPSTRPRVQFGLRGQPH